MSVCLHPPAGLLSEKHSAEDLAQRSGAEQVLGAVQADSREVPQQTVQGQPVLGRQARGAADATQELSALLGVSHLC